MQFTNPIALWGLMGLLIPIGIHLLSRKEGKIIRIGSIRHLEDTNTRQFKSIRLNELGLLALRSLLIAAIVLLLSGLNFSSVRQNENWLVVEKGLEKDKEFSSLIDSLTDNNYKIKLLTRGFPELNDSVNAVENINYWQLTTALQAEPLNRVVVLSYNYLKRFQGKQHNLQDKVQWLTKKPRAVEFPLFAIQESKDSIFLRSGKSTADETSFKSSRSFAQSRDYDQSVKLEALDTLSIAIVSDSAFSNDKLIINTALKVLDEKTQAIFDLKNFTTGNFKDDNQSDWTIWISEKYHSPAFSNNSIRFLDKMGETNLLTLEKHNKEYSSWILAKRLNSKIALEGNLTVQLGKILLPSEKYSKLIQEFDRRVLPEKIAWPETLTSAVEKKAIVSTGSSAEILALLILIILMVERFVAYKRNQ